MNGTSETPRECTFRAGAGGTESKPPLAGSTTRCYEKASDAVRVCARVRARARAVCVCVYRLRQYSISGPLLKRQAWVAVCHTTKLAERVHG